MIRIYCDKANAYLKETETLTAKMVNLPTVKFTFSEDWDTYGKLAIVKAGDVSVPALAMVDNSITVPAACLRKSGVNLMIGVYGADGGHALPTVWCACGEILAGVDPESSEPWEDASESAVAQMLGYAKQIQDESEELVETVEKAAEEVDELIDRAEQGAAVFGYMFFDIPPGYGHLMYTKTINVDIDFSLEDDGHLYVEFEGESA